MADKIICGRCTATWTAAGACHCSGCHETFAAPSLFDAHRSQYGERGRCVDPATLVIQSGLRVGQPVMFHRDGMWRGPEMDEAARASRGFDGAVA